MTVSNLAREESLQGDVRLLDALEQMGCTITTSATGVTVEGPSTLRGVDMGEISDTSMTFACVAPFASGRMRIEGVGHTRLPESDRIATIEEGLGRIGVEVRSGPDWIEVRPGATRAARVRAHEDHRIAMSLAVAGLRTPRLVVAGADCVAKIRPDFFERFDRIARGHGTA